MKKSLSLFIVMFIIFNGCTKEEPTAPEEEISTEVLAEATVGPEGGILETEQFKLTIPSGALLESSNIKLYMENKNKPFEGNEATELFRIDGLPINNQKPIRMAIKYSGSLSNSSYIAIGEDGFVKSYGGVLTSYCLFEAYDSSGYLVIDLPISNLNSSQQNSLNKNTGVEEIVRAVGLTNLYGYDTPEGHFGIIGRMDNTTIEQYEELGFKLETAYDLISLKGFKYDKRKSWPILVVLKRITETINGQSMLGYYTSADWLGSHGYMVFDIAIFNYDDLYETLGHEFLHLVQDLYDPRDWESKSKNAGGNHLWLDEATAVYSEEFYSDNPSTYIPPNFIPNSMVLFDGIHKELVPAINHGYGLSAMIKFLVNKYPATKLVNFYDQIANNKHPVEAVIISTADTKEWLEKFYREYILGNIYDRNMEFWLEKAHSTYTINAGNKTRTLAHNYPDISGRIYKIEINHSDFGENKSLEFSVDGGELSHLTLFKYNTNNLKYIADNTNSLISPKISVLKNDNSNLLALVTNNRAKSPFTDKIKLILSIDTKEIINITSCFVALRNLDVTYIRTYNSGGSETENLSFSTGFFHGDGSTISFSNNTFTQSHDYTGNDGIHYTGFVELKFDEGLKEVLSFNAKSKMVDEDKYYGYTSETELSGHNIEKTSSNEYIIEGLLTCSKMGSVKYYKQYSSYKYELQSVIGCNDSTEIEISIY